MKSDIMKKGPERAPQRSLLKAAGYSDNEIKKPLIGIVNSFNEIVPGHVHLERISRAVKDDGTICMAQNFPYRLMLGQNISQIRYSCSFRKRMALFHRISSRC